MESYYIAFVSTKKEPKVTSKALGHASVAFTMDVYSHIIEGMQSNAMALLDEMLPSGVNGARYKTHSNYPGLAFP